jgi:hypothetical protein
MFTRVAIPAFLLTVSAAVLACRGPVSKPAGAAIAAGIGMAGSVVSRATGWCYAQCLPGTTCNHKTGLCEREDPKRRFTKPPATPGGTTFSANALPPAQESEIPPLPDAGCEPTATDGGSLMCEMDAAAP